MTTITIKSTQKLSKTEFEDLDELKAYLLSDHDQKDPIGFTPEQLGKLWDQGIESGDPISFDPEKEQHFLEQLEAKYSK